MHKSRLNKKGNDMSLWAWLSREKNRKILSFIGGGLVVMISAGWVVITFFFTQPAVVQNVRDNGTAISQTGSGTIYVTNTQGISTEDYKRLAEELGVTQAALGNFFKIVDQKQVAPENLDATLREIAKSYQTLRAELSTLQTEDPAVAKLKKDATTALDQGQLHQVEALLKEARAKDLEAAKHLEATREERLRSAAASTAELGFLKNTQLAYVEATRYFLVAAEMLPTTDELKRSEYLNLSGVSAVSGGFYTNAKSAFEEALAMRKKALPAGHPLIAVSLNNLAGFYQTQGRYAEAEPLLKEALAMLEKALPAGHPDTAKVRQNLADLRQRKK